MDVFLFAGSRYGPGIGQSPTAGMNDARPRRYFRVFYYSLEFARLWFEEVNSIRRNVYSNTMVILPLRPSREYWRAREVDADRAEESPS